jgi:hypothetical protein
MNYLLKAKDQKIEDLVKQVEISAQLKKEIGKKQDEVDKLKH